MLVIFMFELSQLPRYDGRTRNYVEEDAKPRRCLKSFESGEQDTGHNGSPAAACNSMSN
jgi:hypothetical protein